MTGSVWRWLIAPLAVVALVETGCAPTPRHITDSYVLGTEYGWHWNCASWSPSDSRLLVVDAAAKVIRIYDEDLEEILVTDGHPVGRGGTAWSPDGSRIVFYDIGEQGPRFRILDSSSGEDINADNSVDGDVPEWSPDGTALALISGRSLPEHSDVVVVDGDTLAPVTSFEFPNEVQGVEWSPDGNYLVAVSSGEIRVWNASDWIQIAERSEGQVYWRQAAWSPDGSRIATGGIPGKTDVWDALTLDLLLQVSPAEVPNNSMGNAVSWSPDGRYVVSGNLDGTIYFWDSTSGVLTYILEGHTNAITCLSWSADGYRLASSSLDGSVRIWDMSRYLDAPE